MTPQQLREQYNRFLRSTLSGDVEVAAQLIAPGFRIDLTGAELDLTFTEHMQVISPLREALPSLSDGIRTVIADAFDLMVLTNYIIEARFAGTLRNADNSKQLSPTGETITFAFSDTVWFTSDGQIELIKSETDMPAVLRRMFA